MSASSNYNANWIDWDDWEDANGSWQTVTTCTRPNRKRGKSPLHEQSDSGCPTTTTPGTAASPTATRTTTNSSRTKPTDATCPIGQASTLFPAEQYGNCPVAMMGLSYNWTAMNSLVDSMQPNGNTNQPIGLVWGWQSLVGGGPLTAPAKDSNYNYQRCHHSDVGRLEYAEPLVHQPDAGRQPHVPDR